ncbi:CG0192-related protein [Actinophytocola sp. KF-1]
MALIHRATLTPTKLELLAARLPGLPWFPAPGGDLDRVAGYRFDDPAGAVGIETMLVRAGDGPVHQVPLTYRAAPLAGADAWLLGTAEHSVLGTRWVYDAVGDPVYAAALAHAVLTGAGQAEEVFEDGERRAPTMAIAGAGGAAAPAVGAVVRVTGDDPVVIVTDTVELTLARRLDADVALPGTVLTGTWPGQDTPVPLASALAP